MTHVCKRLVATLMSHAHSALAVPLPGPNRKAENPNRITRAGFRGLLLALTSGLVCAGSGQPALATVIDEGANNFGHLSQNNPGLAGVCVQGVGGPSFACGPVAAVNSFVYLQTLKGPGGVSIYDNSLIAGGNLVNTATMLAGPNFMNCMACAGGTLIGNFSSGKMKWIEGSVPGKTVYSSKQNHSIFDLLLDLSAGEDTELLVGFYDRTGARVGGHYVTLYMASSATEGKMLGFIDPDPNPASNVSDSYTVLGGPGPLLQINDYGPANDLARVEYAIDESPIPEPGTLVLVLSTVPLVGWAIRKRSSGLWPTRWPSPPS